jgi:hypothetical protein
MSMHLTTQELDAARAKYRGQIIPADALSVMDAETEARAAKLCQSVIMKSRLRTLGVSRRGQ